VTLSRATPFHRFATRLTKRQHIGTPSSGPRLSQVPQLPVCPTYPSISRARYRRCIYRELPAPSPVVASSALLCHLFSLNCTLFPESPGTDAVPLIDRCPHSPFVHTARSSGLDCALQPRVAEVGAIVSSQPSGYVHEPCLTDPAPIGPDHRFPQDLGWTCAGHDRWWLRLSFASRATRSNVFANVFSKLSKTGCSRRFTNRSDTDKPHATTAIHNDAA